LSGVRGNGAVEVNDSVIGLWQRDSQHQGPYDGIYLSGVVAERAVGCAQVKVVVEIPSESTSVGKRAIDMPGDDSQAESCSWGRAVRAVGVDVQRLQGQVAVVRHEAEAHSGSSCDGCELVEDSLLADQRDLQIADVFVGLLEKGD
jgi:hypothetical protein